MEASQICLFCHDVGPGEQHPMFFCPIRGTEYQNFKTGLTFPPFIICYICAVPFSLAGAHHAPIIPPLQPIPCNWADVIKPIAFYVFMHPATRAAVSQSLGVDLDQFVNLMEYQAWLVQGSEDGLLNIHDIVLAYQDTVSVFL
jgi:hypothetical protein